MKPLFVFFLALAAFGAIAHVAMADAVAKPEGDSAPQPPVPETQLRRNLHDIRVMLEQEYAESEAASRGSTGLIVNPADAPGIGALRQQLSQSMERLEDRCFGLDVKVKDGNAIVICGNNNGTADNTNVRSQTDNLYQPAPPAPAPAEEPAPVEPAPEETGT